MIYDSISNIGAYKGLSENFDRAIDFLTGFDEAAWPVGRHEISGDDVYFIIQNNALIPRESTKFEAHEKYIDIQLALTDGEEIGYAPADTLEWTDFRPENDVKFTALNAGGLPLPMKQGMFAVFFPNDGHAPLRKAGEITESRKVVVKIRV